MANEIKMLGYPSGETLYGCVRNGSGQIWYPTNEEFEDVGTSGRTNNDYAITMVDKSGGMYLADFPEDISEGTYFTVIFKQLSSSPADSDYEIGGDKIDWTGVSEAAEAVTEIGATDVCNRAFLKIGTAKEQTTITSIYDGSEGANLCLVLYPQVRNEVLQRWPWNECREFADLGAELSGIEMADYEYVFNLPADCLAVVAQIDENNRTIIHEHEIRRGMLFTDIYSNADGDSAYIEYIIKVVDTSKYSPALVEAIATKLAAELAPTIKPSETLRLKQEYEMLVLPGATGLNQAEQFTDDKGSHSWLDV